MFPNVTTILNKDFSDISKKLESLIKSNVSDLNMYHISKIKRRDERSSIEQPPTIPILHISYNEIQIKNKNISDLPAISKSYMDYDDIKKNMFFPDSLKKTHIPQSHIDAYQKLNSSKQLLLSRIEKLKEEAKLLRRQKIEEEKFQERFQFKMLEDKEKREFQKKKELAMIRLQNKIMKNEQVSKENKEFNNQYMNKFGVEPNKQDINYGDYVSKLNK